MKEYLKEYLITLRIERNLSFKTCDAYKRDLTDYLSFIKAEKITKITQMDIRNYIREDDRKAKEGLPKGQIDWAYLLRMADSF